MFPSPFEATIFSIEIALFTTLEEISFRPLSRLLSSQLCRTFIYHFLMIVSVPFRGYYLLNTIQLQYMQLIKKVSVPFRGYYLLNTIQLQYMQLIKKVSVPFRGYYLLNKTGVSIYVYIRHKFPSPFEATIFSILRF